MSVTWTLACAPNFPLAIRTTRRVSTPASIPTSAPALSIRACGCHRHSPFHESPARHGRRGAVGGCAVRDRSRAGPARRAASRGIPVRRGRHAVCLVVGDRSTGGRLTRAAWGCVVRDRSRAGPARQSASRDSPVRHGLRGAACRLGVYLAVVDLTTGGRLRPVAVGCAVLDHSTGGRPRLVVWPIPSIDRASRSGVPGPTARLDGSEYRRRPAAYVPCAVGRSAPASGPGSVPSWRP